MESTGVPTPPSWPDSRNLHPHAIQDVVGGQIQGPADPGGFGGVHVIQMNGPVEGVCPAAALACVAITCYPTKEYEFSPQDPDKWPIQDVETYEAALELAGMRAAAYLGRVGEDHKPDTTDVYELPAVSRIPRGMENLPKVAYISSIAHSNGPLPQNFHANTTPPVLYGGSASGLLAMIVHPNDYLDGAVLRPHDFHYDTAYGMQNDPYIQELYRCHGKTLCFVGVVLTQHLWETASVNAANQMAVNIIVDVLGADGVVVHKSGGGAPHGSTAQICRMCEDAGVKAVFLRSSQIPIYPNPEPLFGIINLAESPNVKLPDVDKVIGFHRDIANPPRDEITAMLYQPLLTRGGEKYQGVPRWIPLDDPLKGVPPNVRILTPKTGAERAIDMLLNKIAGKSWKPEVIVEGAIPPALKPAPGVKEITRAKIAFVSGGGLVKMGELPFTNLGATDGRFAQYDLSGVDALNPKGWEILHGGYTPSWINEDPHRLVPLPEIRQLLTEGKFGSFYETLFSWSSLVGHWDGCRKVGEGILPLLKTAGVDAVIMDST